MLVLTRKVGERIFINEDIVVQVLSIDSGGKGRSRKVRLGFSAPRSVVIDREESRQRKEVDGADSE